MSDKLASVLDGLIARHRRHFIVALICAVGLGGSGTLLLGLSGWFLAAAAAAGIAGPVAALAFNYMLPAATIRLLAIVRTGARYGERVAAHGGALHVSAQLRQKLFQAIALSPATAALSLTSADSSTCLAQDVGAIEDGLVRRSAIWQTLAAFAAALAVIAFGGWRPAAAILLVALLMIGLITVVSRKVAMHGKAVHLASARCKQSVAALLPASPEIRAYQLEEWAIQRIDTSSQDLGDHQMRLAVLAASSEASLTAGLAFGAAATFCLSSAAGAPIAALATLSAMMAIDALAPLARNWAGRGNRVVAEQRLGALFESVTDRHKTELSSGTGNYPFVIETSTRTAICGRSGSGKTSVIEQLLALRSVAAGHILLDGKDVAVLDPCFLRTTFAWCPQDAALLTGTVRENLLLADPEAGEEQLWEALGDAMLSDTIKTTGGLSRWIGENGGHLSGGERRRLALARAYLRPAPCLLLDEPTEGLDAETEAGIVERLRSRLSRTGQGLVLVSHRPAMLDLVDHRIRFATENCVAKDLVSTRI